MKIFLLFYTCMCHFANEQTDKQKGSAISDCVKPVLFGGRGLRKKGTKQGSTMLSIPINR